MNGDVIGNFPKVDPNCAGCGKPLVIENAWMTDGCPCNTPLGVNSMNETRWRLLMQLQQRQSFEIERLRAVLRPFAECKTTSTGDRDARHWQCLVSAQHLSDARDALGLR